MFSIVLVNPEIPPNTGNIIRLCANTGCQLHLIEPLGFTLEDKPLRRAGLDYHEYTNVKKWPDWQSFRQQYQGRLISFSTRHSQKYSDFAYQPGDALVFGSETAGLPDSVRQDIPSSNQVILPMHENSRSLNLSNTAAIALYEAWRQNDFSGN